MELAGRQLQVDYEPAESRTPLFGGNSNWRGPVWFPLNVLLLEAMLKFHHYYGDDFKIEFPSGGETTNIAAAAQRVRRRLVDLFLRDAGGHRPLFGEDPRFTDPTWNGHLPFHEYFCGETGRGCGAMHQTGWTGTRPAGRDSSPGCSTPEVFRKSVPTSWTERSLVRKLLEATNHHLFRTVWAWSRSHLVDRDPPSGGPSRMVIACPPPACDDRRVHHSDCLRSGGPLLDIDTETPKRPPGGRHRPVQGRTPIGPG